MEACINQSEKDGRAYCPVREEYIFDPDNDEEQPDTCECYDCDEYRPDLTDYYYDSWRDEQ